jgi:hypothetical protein
LRLGRGIAGLTSRAISLAQERANDDKPWQAAADNLSEPLAFRSSPRWREFMLRSFAIALLILASTAAAADASYCGQGSELAAARVRWAGVRQSRFDPADPGKICRTYGSHFYEAAQARQAASLCEDSASRERNLNMLDAEIEAFNNLIAAQCTGS